jgi:hypothetical protein
LAQLPVDEKFISIGQQASVPPRVFQIKVTFELVRDASGGNDRFSIVSERLAFRERRLQEMDRLDQRIIC